MAHYEIIPVREDHNGAEALVNRGETYLHDDHDTAAELAYVLSKASNVVDAYVIVTNGEQRRVVFRYKDGILQK